MRKGHGRRHGPQETHSRGYIGTAVLSTPQDILAWGEPRFKKPAPSELGLFR